ncbi:MAG TPA: YggT family protein [Candidatus Limnocylindrales bacterium]
MSDYERTTVHEPVDEPVDGPPAERRVVRERRYDDPYVAPGPTAADLVRRVVALLFGILQALLILRIVFLLLIANRDNGIVQFVLNVTDPFVAPFVGMFRLDTVRSTSGVVLDFAAVVALIGWSLVEALVLAVLSLGTRRGPTAVA